MAKTLSSLCWTYFVRINSICDQSNCNCQADSGPRPRPRFQSLLQATDWHSCYPCPQPLSALMCQFRQKFNIFIWTHTTIIIWWSMPCNVTFVVPLDRKPQILWNPEVANWLYTVQPGSVLQAQPLCLWLLILIIIRQFCNILPFWNSVFLIRNQCRNLSSHLKLITNI